MGIRGTTAVLLVGLALVLGLAPAAAEDADVRIAPFRGALPAPPGVPLELDEDEPAAYVVQVLDGRTGRPIPGAWVQCFPERILDYLWRHDWLLAQGAADERGFAQVATDGWIGEDSHWVAHAPGYGPVHHYTATPPELMYLLPSIDVSGRVLDPMGRPAPGVLVDYFLGCGHGPSMARATTDAAGRFTLRGINPNDGQLWIEGEGIRADYHDVDDLVGLGDRVHDIVTAPGHTAVGRVLDPRGIPLEGVVVRSSQCHRGPATVTGRDGRYRLHGVEPGHGLYVHHPASLRPANRSAPLTDQFDEDWLPGVERTLRLSPMNLMPPPLATAKLAVAFTEFGEHDATDLVIHLVNLENGTVHTAMTEENGVMTIPLPPGRWRMQSGDPFGALTFLPQVYELKADAVLRAQVSVREQPRLVIEGLPKFWQLLDLLTPAETHRENRDGGVDWSPHVPAEGPLAIRLVTRDESPMQWFHAGPLQDDGTRRVQIALSGPTRIRVFGKGDDGRFGRVWLFEPGGNVMLRMERDAEASLGEGPEEYVTWAVGSAVVSVDAADGDHHIPIDLPAEGGAVIDVDPRSVVVTPDLDYWPDADGPGVSTIRLREAGGRTPGDMTAEMRYADYGGVENASGDVDDALRMRAGAWARVIRPGWHTLHVEPGEPGTRTRAWGDTQITLRITDYEDYVEPQALTVWVDGAVYAMKGATFTLKGLSAGEHELIVVPFDTSAAPREDEDLPDVTGRRVRFTLKAGDRRELAVPMWPEEED